MIFRALSAFNFCTLLTYYQDKNLVRQKAHDLLVCVAARLRPSASLFLLVYTATDRPSFSYLPLSQIDRQVFRFSFFLPSSHRLFPLYYYTIHPIKKQAAISDRDRQGRFLPAVGSFPVRHYFREPEPRQGRAASRCFAPLTRRCIRKFLCAATSAHCAL